MQWGSPAAEDAVVAAQPTAAVEEVGTGAGWRPARPSRTTAVS